MAVVVGPLLALFLRRFVRQRCARPHLAVRVRVGTAHDLPLVFEDLHPAIGPAQVGDLLGPHLHHLPDVRQRHLRQRQVVAGGEADHPARSRFTLRHQERVIICWGGRRIG